MVRSEPIDVIGRVKNFLPLKKNHPALASLYCPVVRPGVDQKLPPPLRETVLYGHVDVNPPYSSEPKEEKNIFSLTCYIFCSFKNSLMTK